MVVLGFHHKSVAMRIHPAAFARNGAVQKVAGLKLQARFRGANFQHAARRWFGHVRVQKRFFVELLFF